MKVQRVYMRDYFVLPHPQVRSYFARQREGQSDVYTTPLWHGRDFNDVLDEWESVLKRDCANYPALLEFENSLRAKVGPLSVEKPLVERLPDIEAYYTGVTLDARPMELDFIQHCWRKRFRAIRNIPLMADVEVLRQMKKSTNSGVPYFTRRGLVIEMGKLGRAELRDGEWWFVTPDGTFKAAAILGWRGQEGGPLPEDVKQRVLWMFAMLLNMLEARVYAPHIKAFQRNHLMPTWENQAMIDATMTKLFDSKDPGDYVVGTDFTKFDQHMNGVAQDCSASMFQMVMQDSSNMRMWLADIFPEKYKIPLIIDWGKAVFGHHGMASGSNGTNDDETMFHSVLQVEAAETAGHDLNPYSMCLGDDGVLTFKNIDVDHVLSVYTSHGLEMNAEKQEVARDKAVFLRRLFANELRGKDGIIHGVYSGYRALGRCKYLERFVKPEDYGPDYIIVHSLSILENLEYHPAREQCVDIVLEGDQYGLGTKIPGYFDRGRFAKTVEKVAAAGGLGWQYTSEFNPRPATSWWTYQYLKSKT